MKHLFWLCCCLCFCFGQISAEENASEKIRIACIGDSITFGSGHKDQTKTSYPVVLQELLGDKVEVKNFGNPGRGVYLSTMRGKDQKRGYYHQSEHQAALKFQPHIVICNLGTNDIDDYRKGKAGDFVADYVKLLNEYKNLPTNPQIIIWTCLTPIANNPARVHRFRKDKWHEPFLLQRELQEVARQTDAIGLDMDAPFRLPNMDALFPDNVHPNEAGSRIIAEVTAPIVRPLIDGNFGGLQTSDFFGDKMILQHSVKFPVWGIANAGEKIDVTFGEQNHSATASKRGLWRVELTPLEINNKSQTLTIKSADKTLTYNNVLVGELWLCAGQSNMLWALKQCSDAKAAQAIFPAPNATPEFPLRLLKMLPPKGWQTGFPWRGKWEIADNNSANNFSGVAAIFLATRHQQHPQMPIGLIQVAHGGAPLESFLSRTAMLSPLLIENIAHYEAWFKQIKYAPWCAKRAQEEIAKAQPKSANNDHVYAPNKIFADGFAQFVGLPLTGILWYQGESNATTNLKPEAEMDLQYCEAGIRALIADVRANFPSAKTERELPFLMVQLPRCDRPWANFRDVQWRIAQDTPNVETIIATDTGVPNDVHPRDKKAIGERLAFAAKRIIDGDEAAGIFPVAKSVSVKDNIITVTFSPAGKLTAKKIDHVELGFAGGKIIATNAELIDSENGSVLQVKYEGESPTEIRYNWVNVPQGNLMSDKNLPVVPFKLKIEK